MIDPSGDPAQQSYFEQYIEESVGFIVVYSVEDRATFERALEIINTIEMIKKDNYKAVLVGNGIDRQKRVVTNSEGSKLATKPNIKFFETSCATGENVQQVFQNLVALFITKILALCNDDGEGNSSIGGEVEEFESHNKSSAHILGCIGVVLIAILITIFAICKLDYNN